MTERIYIKKVGQTPGQMYDAQVIDQDGKGLFAGFFYLDKDGIPIMDDKLTDSNGVFHFTVPDHNHQNIFIQFYATEEYEPVVKTFTEIVENNQIVLTKKKAGVSNALIFSAAAVAILALNKNRNMGSVKEKWIAFKSNPENKKTGSYVLIAGGAALVLYFAFKYKPTPEQKEFLEQAKNRLDYLARELGIVPSLSIAQFTTLSLQLIESFNRCGTEETAANAVFNSLNNEADFWQLCITFGVAKYIGCLDRPLLSKYIHKTLPEAIVSELTTSERNVVNQILRGKDINIVF